MAPKITEPMDDNQPDPGPEKARPKEAKAPSATETVDWLGRKQLSFVYKTSGHRYAFELEDPILNIEERNEFKIFRTSTIDLRRLRDITVSDFSADGLAVSTLCLSGGSRCTTRLLGDRRKTVRTVEIWLDRDQKLAARIARAFAHLGKLARKEHAEKTGEAPLRSVRILSELNTLSGNLPPSIASHLELRTRLLSDMTLFAEGGATIMMAPPEPEDTPEAEDGRE